MRGSVGDRLPVITDMCYADSALALSQCSNCSDDGSRSEEGEASSVGERWPGGTPDYTCSGDLVANGSQVDCDYCCPKNVTELWYEKQ